MDGRRESPVSSYKLPVLVGVVGLTVATVLVLRSLSAVGWDPTLFVSFGEEAAATRAYGEERLGEVYLRSGQGHDGKFYFVQANDPWVVEPEVNASVFDRPLYRSQRMLYPVLAGGFGVLEPATIVWGLVAVNVLMMGLGTFATSIVAMRMGGSPWFGVTFGLNFGFISELYIDGSGIVAAAAAFGAMALLLSKRRWWGIGLLVAAALAREAMLIAAVGSAYWLWKRGERRDAFLAMVAPGLAVLIWAVYLRFRIDLDVGFDQVQEIGWPFVGFVQALPGWMGESLDITAGLGTVLLLALYTRRVLRSNELAGWAFLGFIPLAFVFTHQVWLNYYDFTRALAPVFTSFILLMFLSTPSAKTPDGSADQGVGVGSEQFE